PGAPGAGPSSPSGPASGGGADLGPDLTVWDFWWGFNKEPYLNLRQRVRSAGVTSTSDDFFLGRGQAEDAKDTLRPSPAMIRDQVVPALKKVLETERQNDIITGALIALAKIGDVTESDGESEFQQIFKKWLNNGEQEISETATLALGILADERAVPTLVDLMRDTPEGRKLIGKEVPFRTRSFAAYGLGLIGYWTSDNAVRQTIAEHLIDVIEMPRFPYPDIKVGAIAALGLVPLDWDGEPAVVEEEGNAAIAANRASVLRYLHRRMNPDTRGEDGGIVDFRVRAHAPIAAARLLATHEGEIPAEHQEVRSMVVDRLLELVDKNSKEDRVEVLQSATIALGMVADSATGDGDYFKRNEQILKELERISKEAADNQTEFFALIAIGEMGSRPGPGETPRGLQEDAQKVLLTSLAKGKGQKKPWAALALGVYGNALLENDGTLEQDVVSSVRDVCSKGDRPAEAGAYAISLGLMKDRAGSEELLLERLEYFNGRDEVRGHFAVGLGLMEANASIEELNSIIEKSKFRPELLKQAAIGLGLLGDKTA
ncbi:MAG: hypothetical protein AAGA20_25080, partial [Planctomycetota bacterium]